MAKTVKVDATAPLRVTVETLAQLSEEECKRALSLANLTIEYARKMTLISMHQAIAFVGLCELRDKHIRKWDEKASELAEMVQARELQVKKMAAGLKSFSKRLNTLASASQTVAKGRMSRRLFLFHS